MKKVLITGASRGIGKATAKKMLGDGYAVIGAYHESETEAKRVEKEYDNLIMLPVDLTSRASTLSFIAAIGDQKLLGIVNNAGIFEEDHLEVFDTSNFDNNMAIHATAPLLIVQKLLKNLDKGSAVVNVSSTDAYFGGYLGVSYAASKAALISVTKSLAVLLGPKGIRVNAVAPGWIDTALGAEGAGVDKAAIYKTPLGRNGEPEEVADLIMFLLSDKASFINGTVVDIDGGYSVVDEVLKKESENNSK